MLRAWCASEGGQIAQAGRVGAEGRGGSGGMQRECRCREGLYRVYVVCTGMVCAERGCVQGEGVSKSRLRSSPGNSKGLGSLLSHQSLWFPTFGAAAPYCEQLPLNVMQASVRLPFIVWGSSHCDAIWEQLHCQCACCMGASSEGDACLCTKKV